MKKKHICIVTGTRSEHGTMILLIKRLEESEKLNLSLIVTGTHLLKEHGNTIDLVKKEGIPIKRIVPMYREGDSSDIKLGKAVGTAIINFTEALNELKPDLLLLVGDRFESLAAAVAASTLSIPIAHVYGGDSVPEGQVDEQIRHALTKLSHIHFPATPKSFERVKLLGEEEWRIHMVGNIAIDMILIEDFQSKEETWAKFDLNPSEKVILCLQHPYSYEANQAGEQMKLTLEVLKELNLQTVIIYPNSDPGSELIIKEIESRRDVKNFKIFNNIERRDYLSLLKDADLLIGNSSSGIVESPIFKIPVVNIGNRNKARESCINIIDVLYDYEEIKNGVTKGLSNEFVKICQESKNPYGDGSASEKIVKIIEELQIDKKKLLVKRLTYQV